jgi:hypothetical protein
MEMERRVFLTKLGAVIVLLPAARLLSGCGSSTPGVPANGGIGVTSTPTLLTFTSSVVLGHTHTFPILISALTSPPNDGFTGNTSTTNAHTHVVTLSESDLSTIESGQVVTKTTSSTEAHTHDFAFTKLASGGTTGGGTTGATGAVY